MDVLKDIVGVLKQLKMCFIALLPSHLHETMTLTVSCKFSKLQTIISSFLSAAASVIIQEKQLV